MVNDVDEMSYVQFMAFLGEINRPPGGKVAFKKLLDYCNVTSEYSILDIGCNTGFCSFEAVWQKKCKVTGVDLSSEMILEAKNKSKNDDLLKKNITFLVANAKKLPFEDGEFDFVFSGGSTAFVDDIVTALKEYKRVAKTWSYIGDINFFYEEDPREGLIEELNDLMGTSIIKWTKEDWIEVYEEAGLEVFDILEGSISEVSDEKVASYVEELLQEQSEDIRESAKTKLSDIMSLFNENHKYLKYGIFILRKRGVEEEPFLFLP